LAAYSRPEKLFCMVDGEAINGALLSQLSPSLGTAG
jgi:hypothetical protein